MKEKIQDMNTKYVIDSCELLIIENSSWQLFSFYARMKVNK